MRISITQPITGATPRAGMQRKDKRETLKSAVAKYRAALKAHGIGSKQAGIAQTELRAAWRYATSNGTKPENLGLSTHDSLLAEYHSMPEGRARMNFAHKHYQALVEAMREGSQ